mgnify:CR=1 FL=1
MINFEKQYRYNFSCTVSNSYTSQDRELITGSFESYYQLTDHEVKQMIVSYAPVGYKSVADFDWKEEKL